MGNGLNGEQPVYDRLWQEAVAAFAAGGPVIDPHLPDKTRDLRRGLTLLCRPDREVQRAIGTLLAALAEVAPGQYFYRPQEFHVTILSIVPGSELWQDKIGPLTTYRSVVGKVLNGQRGFSIAFRGVTASAHAVLVQGFATDATLAELRDRLREELQKHNVAAELARKYRIQTAHLTIMRFCRPDTDWDRLKRLLESHRTTSFGETRVENAELVLTDWYASADRLRLLETYGLG